jgi:hypothetical protein
MGQIHILIAMAVFILLQETTVQKDCDVKRVASYGGGYRQITFYADFSAVVILS